MNPMDDKRLITLAAFISILGIVFICGYEVGRRSDSNRQNAAVKTKVVQVIKHDTITLIPQVERIYRRDTIMIPIRDTIKVSDTVYASVDREYKVYSDSLYRAIVSGYQPRLDSLELYQKTIKEYLYIDGNKRWHIGLQAGFGVSVSRNPQYIPYIGLGVTYSLFSF